MKNLTPEFLAQSCGGVLRNADAVIGQEIAAVTTDSREVKPGALFAAICGERVDGHSFIPDVMEKGALLVLTEKAEAAEGYPYILVDNTEEALGKIAYAYLQGLGVKVVSISGSVGKTSTKEMIAAVLSRKFKTKKTPGNLNNALGLPLTVFTLEEGDELAVLEMGINHFGEMDVLGRIAPPDAAVITNIGACHLEFLGDLDGVFRAKTEIFAHVKEGGTVILNGDDPRLAAVTEVKGKKPVFYGLTPGLDVFADHIEQIGLEAVRCVLHLGEESIPVRIPYPGNHMAINAAAAAAVGITFGLLPIEIKRGIESLELPAGRLRTIRGSKGAVIDDCYNANPMSMKASLTVLSRAEGRRVAILGDMGELGEDAPAFHREVGEYAAFLPLDLLISVGTNAKLIAQEMEENGTARAISFDTLDELLENEAAPLLSEIEEGDTVLLKASHSMEFGPILDVLVPYLK